MGLILPAKSPHRSPMFLSAIRELPWFLNDPPQDSGSLFYQLGIGLIWLNLKYQPEEERAADHDTIHRDNPLSHRYSERFSYTMASDFDGDAIPIGFRQTNDNFLNPVFT